MSSDVVRRAYAAWAAIYDVADNPLIAQAAVALAARADWLAGRVLELGCGTGRNARLALAAGCATYTGLDASPEMLAVARQIEDPRAAWLQVDLAAETVPLPEHDLVLISLVLEHFPSVAPVIETAAAALAPGGRLVILELHPSMHARGVGANFKDAEGEVRLPSFRHDAAEMAAAGAACGLRLEVAIDHVPSPQALERSAKLGRYVGTPVLLEVVLTKGPRRNNSLGQR